MTPEQSADLNPKLPSGWMALVQEKLLAKGIKLSNGQVSKCKNGKSQNPAVDEVLLEVAREAAEKRKATTKLIAQIG